MSSVKEGYRILIIDSSSHEWEGKGGCLELQQQAGGTYQAWGMPVASFNAEYVLPPPLGLINATFT